MSPTRFFIRTPNCVVHELSGRFDVSKVVENVAGVPLEPLMSDGTEFEESIATSFTPFL